MKYLELKEQLKSQIMPIYTIIGDDDYLISNAIKMIKKVTVDNAQEINYDCFNDENYSIQAIMNSVQQLAFISAKRMVLVYLPDKPKKEELEQFSKYSQSPNPDVVLVIVDKNNTFKKGSIIDCNKLTNQELIKVIPNFFKKYNKSITLDGANKLVEICQNDTMRISKEIEKLAYYCEEDIVKIDDVEMLVKAELQFEVFKLINHIASKNKNQALKQINGLIESKEDIHGVISLISNTFRRMFYSKITNISSQELADKLGIKLFAVTKAKENANSFSQKQLKKILDICEEVDFLTKQGQLSPINALHVLVFSIFILP